MIFHHSHPHPKIGQAVRHLAYVPSRRFNIVAVLCLLCIGLLPNVSWADKSVQEWVQEGNRSWNEKSYAQAEEAYRKALTADPKLPERPQLEFRILFALSRERKWDDAIAVSNTLLEEPLQPEVALEAQLRRARLFINTEHEGYRVGQRIYRGYAVPRSEGGNRPVRVDLYEEDREKSIGAFLRAREILKDLERKPSSPQEPWIRTHIETDHNLIELLDSTPPQKVDPDRIDWKIDLQQPFRLQWSVAKQVMYLYADIMALDAERPNAKRQETVFAALGQAGYILQLRQGFRRMPDLQSDSHRRRLPVAHIIPYALIDPIHLLKETLRRNPKTPASDRLAYTIALWTEQREEYPQAAAAYKAVIRHYPQSPFAEYAQERLEFLFSPQLSIREQRPTRPGVPVKLTLETRNLPQVRFTAYRAPLEKIFGHTSYRGENGSPPVLWPSFDDLKNTVFAPKNRAAIHREKAATWTYVTSSDNRHNRAVDQMTTPITSLGAYVIEARGVNHPEIAVDTFVLVTDIAIIQTPDKDSSLVYVADSKTGKPIPNANVLAWLPGPNGYPYDFGARYLSTKSGADGIAKIPLGTDAAAFAYLGGHRYAFTEPCTLSSDALPIGEDAFHALIYTDRPLYRPGQKVNYRLVMTQGAPGQYVPAAGKEVTLNFRGGRGESLQKTIHLDPTGTYHGSYDLLQHADLGDYEINVTSPVRSENEFPHYYGATSFRVEEYKKPEFAVDVRPEKSEVKVGEQLNTIVSAAYFFGKPVPHATIHYRVYRWPTLHRNPFHTTPDWYYNFYADRVDGVEDMANVREQLTYWGAPSKLYREGNVNTDDHGEAKLTFPTDPPKLLPGMKHNPGKDMDQSFTILVDVTDDSRRVVSGSGTVRASALRFHAALHLDHKFFLPHDPITVEVNTQDANDRPLAAKGTLTFWRQIPAIPAKTVRDARTGKPKVIARAVPAREVKETMQEVQTDTDKDGTSSVVWRPSVSSNYRIEYTAQDGEGNSVRAEQKILVYGPDFDSRLKPNDRRCELIADQDAYVPGETARLLLITPYPDCDVLFARQAVGVRQGYTVLSIPGRSRIIEVPIGNAYLPNAQFTANLVRAEQSFRAQADVDVLAMDRILTLAVTPDRPDYKPGEPAVFHLHAVDSSGRPVKAELSLGVVDEALLAMQADGTPDIRTYFYSNAILVGLRDSISSEFAFHPEDSGMSQPNYNTERIEIPKSRDPDNPGRFIPTTTLPDYDFISLTSAQVRHWKQKLPSIVPDSQEISSPSNDDIKIVPPPATSDQNAQDLETGEYGSVSSLASQLVQWASILPEKIRPGKWISNQEIRQFATASMLPPPPNPMQAVLAAATVRRTFADTAYWMPAVTTDASGDATVAFAFPDNITQWHITARGITPDVKVGVVEGQSSTKKRLLVRIQSPRFFVDRDQVTLSANLHNYLPAAKNARVELVLDPRVFAPVDSAASLVRMVPVDKDSEARLDWNVKVLKPGTTAIKVIAQTDQESDAAELTFPVRVHGMEKFLADSGVLHNGGEATLTLDLPKARRKGASLLDVQMSPSLASVLLDALPYLEDYPYGCVEQTLDRFVPTVTVAKSLKEAGIGLESLGKRAQALEEQRRSVPVRQAYENSGYTYPNGIPGALDADQMASRMFLQGRSHAPVFDTRALQSMTEEGLQALYTMQRLDGGWGWWKGSRDADPYLSAYALEGLLRSKQAGIPIKDSSLRSAISYLNRHLDQTQEPNLLTYFSYVLALLGEPEAHIHGYERFVLDGTDPPNADLRGVTTRYQLADAFLYTHRDQLSPYAMALLARTLHIYHDDDKAGVVIRNLVTTAKHDTERGTVHWESSAGDYWRWYNDKQETTAAVLQALVEVGPNGQLAPQNSPPSAQTGLASMAVRWLVDSRRGGHWTSTRQTANVVEALLEYAKAQKELIPDYTVTVDVDGKVKKSYHIDADNALFFDNRFLAGDEVLTSGGQKLTIHMQGTGTLYWNSYLQYFDLREPIQATSNAIAVERTYYKLVPTENKSGKAKAASLPSGSEERERVPLPDGSALTSGDIIEVELHLKSDNDYAYVVFEDMKPAGCEAVETRSGEAYGDGLCSNIELRDEKVAFFLDTLPQGEWRITYRLRAEVPGVFHALPTNGYAMYTPDIRATSDEWRVTINDLPTSPGK